MGLQLEDMLFSDGPAYANTYISSFYKDLSARASGTTLTFEQRVAGVIQRWPRNYHEKGIIYKKIVDSDSGDLVSWLKIKFENTDISPNLIAPINIPKDIVTEPQTTDHRDTKKYVISPPDSSISRVVAVRLQNLGDRRAIILYLLGTHPKAQRRGAASLLMAWVTEVADRESLPCWVTASPDAVPLYKKFGFKVIEEVTVPLNDNNDQGTYTDTCMLREPNGQQAIA